MQFDGHQLYTIGNDWVFDLTEFIGYKVIKKNGHVSSYEKAFSVEKNINNTDFKFSRDIKVPAGVVRKVREIITNYYKEAMLDVNHGTRSTN